MTRDEKAAVAAFLYTTEDYLSGGYRQKHRPAAAANAMPVTAGIPAAAAMPAAAPPDSTGETVLIPGNDSLEAVALEIERCGRCVLCQTRKKTSPGEGVRRPLVMVIGEGPGRDEDAAGRPFVGPAGQLLDRMLDAKGRISLSRTTNCYIANIVKCRASRQEGSAIKDRPPSPGEIAACLPFLVRQIRLLKPKIILAAGNTAVKTLLGTTEGISRIRGKCTEWTGFTPGEFSIPLLPTFHPSALLREESYKAPAWEDMKTLRTKLCELDGDYAAQMASSPL